MNEILPYVIVRSPAGQERKILLTSTRYTIGRLPENDIDLPDDVITRKKHCVLKREGTAWYLEDEESTNGTILRREEQQIEVQSCPKRRIRINSGDLISIHGWELVFYDLNQKTTNLNQKTTNLKGLSSSSSPSSYSQPVCPLVYKVSQATLYKISKDKSCKIILRPKVRQMLGYMAEKNLHNKEPILCSYRDLITYLWGKHEFDYNRKDEDLKKMASEIRKLFCHELQDEWDEPEKLLETIKDAGYILWITCKA